MKNAMSIDLEDWFCVYNLSQAIRKEDWDTYELRVVENTKRILQLFDKHRTEATFFVLGWIAERVPELIRDIERQGHEVAVHGYSHTLLTEMTPETFEHDLQKALEVTKRCIRQEIVGYRAPSFSITEKTLWALDILAQYGFRYDSSMFPVRFHPDYGMPGVSLSIHRLNHSLIEVPLSCAEILGIRIPCSGGGYFRIFPYALTKFLMKRCHKQGRPVIFYLHPWEIDPHLPRMKLPPFKKFRSYYNLDKTLNRLDTLLSDFEFTSIKKVIGL
jgi:polysaccharide deacetylase family protein (PEP-CTERM system associated)